MRRPSQIRHEPDSPLRVMLVDANPVFRGACRALLMTEGVDVVADCAPRYGVLDIVQRLRPDVVLAEANAGTLGGRDIAARICSLPDRPAVLLISTNDLAGVAAAIGASGHLAKADICAVAIAQAITPATSPLVASAEPGD
jgi:DNA-binding NarL/FixJ family response regulator